MRIQPPLDQRQDVQSDRLKDPMGVRNVANIWWAAGFRIWSIQSNERGAHTQSGVGGEGHRLCVGHNGDELQNQR
jgi:hypothetical protein